MTREWGPWLVGGGLLLLVGGLLAWTGALSWLGNLPGDIRISSGNTRIYIPITSMVLVSVGPERPPMVVPVAVPPLIKFQSFIRIRAPEPVLRRPARQSTAPPVLLSRRCIGRGRAQRDSDRVGRHVNAWYLRR